MTERNLSERPYLSLWPFIRMVAGSSAGASLLELDGVIASVVPATPGRSVVNSVAYTSAASLEHALEALAAAYAEASVRAWTVWVPEGDTAAQRLLAESGHALDASPAAMAIELAGFDGRASSGLDLDRSPAPADIGRINDAAYGFDGDFTRAFAQRPNELNLYAARVDGEPLACVGSIHEKGDCGIYLVATLPAARGRGLSSELMAVALREARESGCGSASLQATAMGEPVYARLGFSAFGTIQMWERRAT